MTRADPSGRRLSRADAAEVLGMIARGDRKHDIAAWFGVNQGRIADVQNGKIYPGVNPAAQDKLPPSGPYTSGRAASAAIKALEDAKAALELAAEAINQNLEAIRKDEDRK